jgi:hypothetical protein
MTPEELAALRRMATTAGLVSITGKELSTLLLERDHHAAKAKALREAARAVIDGLIKHLDAHDVAACEDWANPDVECGGIATRRLMSGSGDEVDLCDTCAAEREDRGWILSEEFPYAAPLRALRALLEAP